MKKTLLVLLFVFGLLLSVGMVSAAIEITPIAGQAVDEGDELSFIVEATGNISEITYSIDTNATGSTFDRESGEFLWTPGFSQAGVYYANITADDGDSNDTISISITVNDKNRDPTFKSTPDTSVYAESDYTYYAIAEDLDGDSITYALITGPSGMSMESTTSRGILEWEVPSTTGDYYIKISASDSKGGVAYQEFNLTVEEKPPRLEVRRVYAKTPEDSRVDLDDGDDLRVYPGDEITFYVEVKNIYDDDIDLEDVYFNLMISSLLDEGDDDLDEESDETDIRPLRTDKLSITFTVPTRIQTDGYDVSLIVYGTDEDGYDYSEELNYELTVRKESNAIQMTRADVSPTRLFCDQETRINLEAVVENIGRNEIDDLVIKVTSEDLGIDYEEDSIELYDDPYDTDSRYILSTGVNALAQKEGTYSVIFEAYLEGRMDVYDSEVVLITAICDSEPTPTPSITPTPIPTPTYEPTPTPTVVREKPFTETNLFLGILIAAVVLLGVLVILMLSLLFRK